ncbi:hypothetical protein L1049_017051 [Liquidambar formosana]|uniref:S-adenosylmethionine decarboxylase proenzyme n=1 Tax=Liquidambar formosana TaxID=63359 RepID=A0AAP0X3W0_LIQFO
MDPSGFKGVEKRLELHFSGGGSNLRQLFDSKFLEQVFPHGTADSTVENPFFDSYVVSMSESEARLFVYPSKIIIKTCGTDQICESIRQFKDRAQENGLTPSVCGYTQGFFTLRPSESFPHNSFDKEVASLKEMVPSSFCKKEEVIMPSNMPLSMPSHSLGVWIACDQNHNIAVQNTPDGIYTIQVCMIQLDSVLAKNFGHKSFHKLRDELRGNDPNWHLVRNLTPSPCRFSTRGIRGDGKLMIDVTQEVRSYGYASFECVGSIEDVVQMLKMVVHVFDPATMSVSTTCINSKASTEVMKNAVENIGLICRSCSEDKSTAVMFQTFSARHGD